MATFTFHHGTDAFPERQAAVLVVLTKGKFQVEQRQTTEHHHYEIGEKKCTTTVSVGDIGKPRRIEMDENQMEKADQNKENH